MRKTNFFLNFLQAFAKLPISQRRFMFQHYKPFARSQRLSYGWHQFALYFLSGALGSVTNTTTIVEEICVESQ